MRLYWFGMISVVNTACYLPIGIRGIRQVQAEKALIQDLICYDRVWIISEHLSAVGMLCAIMGAKALEYALDSKAIGFIHDRLALSYPMIKEPSPFLLLRTIEDAQRRPGFSDMSADKLAYSSLHGFGIPEEIRRRIAEKAALASLDLDLNIKDKLEGPGDTPESGVLREIDLYKSVVGEMKDYPVSKLDLERLEKNLRNPLTSWFRKPSRQLQVLEIKQRRGWETIEPKEPLSEMQLGMLALTLSSRFLRAQALLEGNSTLHTDSLVECVLQERLKSYEKAASTQIDRLLQLRQIPVLQPTGLRDFPYHRLLDKRQKKSGIRFRQLVEEAETTDRTLIESFLAKMDKTLSERFSVKVTRFLVVQILGKVPVLGDIAALANVTLVSHLLKKGTARYFVDRELNSLM